MTEGERKAMRATWQYDSAGLDVSYKEAVKAVRCCLDALEVANKRIAELEDELGPLRAFQRNHLPGGCE